MQMVQMSDDARRFLLDGFVVDVAAGDVVLFVFSVVAQKAMHSMQHFSQYQRVALRSLVFRCE